MRIPHSINSNMFDEYLPSLEALSLVLEKDRGIRSEHMEWDKDHPQRLAEICIYSIAANFERNPILNEMPCADQDFLLEILPTDLPLPLVLRKIRDGIYWKRKVSDRWKDVTNRVEDYGGSWKRLYMERHVQEMVEEFSPEGYNSDVVYEMCELASDYVQKLDLRQLKMVQPSVQDDFSLASQQCFDHIDLSPIISGLRNLKELHIQFGVRNIGSNYKKTLFELSKDDCKRIGEGVMQAMNLKVLRIHQSALDDEKVIELLSSMRQNKTLRKIEFSNCLIGDDGAIAVAKFLREKDKIKEVNLCNNRIGEAGLDALSFVLTKPDTSGVEILNLRFNAFGNSGLQYLASALIRENPKVKNLNISCCNLDEECAILLAEMLRRNTVLRELDLSCNRFGEKGGRAMESAMNDNKTLLHLDLRMTEISNEDMVKISRNLHFNRIRARKGEKGVEKEIRLIAARAEEERRRLQEEEELKAQQTEEIPAPEAPKKKKKRNRGADDDDDGVDESDD